MSKNKLSIIVSAIALILMYSFSLACGGTGGELPTSSTSTSESVKEEPVEESVQEKVVQGSKESPHASNLFVTVEEVEWKILYAEDLGDTLEALDDYHEDETTDGKFIKVRFSVKNNGSEMKSLTSLKLFDDQDREFTDYSGSSAFIEDEEELFLLDNVNPGMGGTYTVIYEVPKDASNLMLEVTGLEFISKEEYISLDLGEW